MARVDDYQQARDLAARELAEHSLDEVSNRSGLPISEKTELHVPFLGRTYRISHPEFNFSAENDGENQVPLQEQVLILHYLLGSRPELKNLWIAYREIPGAGFYFGAFVKRAVEPLKKVFGANISSFQTAATRLGGSPVDTGSAAYEFKPLPYTPLQLILWEGDEEFPPEANILFDASVGDYLSPEDAAWLASLVVYRLIGMAR